MKNYLREQLQKATAAGLFTESQANTIAIMVEYHEDADEVPKDLRPDYDVLMAVQS